MARARARAHAEYFPNVESQHPNVETPQDTSHYMEPHGCGTE